MQTQDSLISFILRTAGGGNISNAVNISITSAMWNKQYDNTIFEDDAVFSEDTLPIDAILEKWIETGDYIEEAKTLLNLK